MKRTFIQALVIVLMLSLATLVGAEAKKGGKATEGQKVVRAREVTLKATVEAIDLEKRIVTLKTPKGEVRKIKVGEQAKNLAQVKVGDLVTIKYLESIAVEVIKSGPAAGAGETSAIVRSKPGEMPGGTAARQVTVTATVTSIDKKRNYITLKGPEGDTVDVKVQDPNNLKKVKVGDDLLITYTEALAISVERAKKK